MGYWYPPNIGAWRDGAVMLGGALVGAALRAPLAWAVGPLALPALLWVVACGESSWSADAEGDDGTSVGMMQFQAASFVEPWFGPKERTSPWASGWSSAAHIQSGLLRDPRWLLALWLPAPWCVGAARALWRRGTGGFPGFSALRGWQNNDQGERAPVTTAYLSARLATLALAGALAFGFRRVARG